MRNSGSRKKSLYLWLRHSSRFKLLIISALAPGLTFFSVPLQANPTGGVVVHGDVSIGSGAGGNLQINQNSLNAIINWNDFSIDAGELTQFNQPGVNAAVLNRVTGGNPSEIHGALRSNGSVFVINPNGILVGPSGTIDVHGLVLSTLDISNGEFLAGGDLVFKGSGEGVTNMGRINAIGGDVFLIGRTVTNTGSIRATGTVGLAAGEEVLLKAQGDSMGERVFVRATGAGASGTGVLNDGTIEGAAVELKAHGNMYALAINNKGSVRATGATSSGGRVYLRGAGGTVSNSGSIRASSSGGGNSGRLVIEAAYARVDGAIAAEKARIAATQKATISGGINVGSTTSSGGELIVEAPEIDLTATADINATGATGGGVVQIGGGFQGRNADISNATTLNVDSGASIVADATANGNGGVVILWSDDTTTFSGSVSSRGAGAVGNGGFVEISGKQNLGYDGMVDLSSDHGLSGTLLLDPTNVTISNAAASATVVNNVDLSNTLDAGTNVIVTSNFGAAGPPGDITVDDRVEWYQDAAGTPGGTLTILATGDVLINDSVRSAGSGGINIVAGWDGTTGIVDPLSGGAQTDPGSFDMAAVLNTLPGGSNEGATDAAGLDPLFGTDFGSIQIGNNAITTQIVVGSRFGATNVAGHDLTLKGGQDGGTQNRFVQLGFNDTGYEYQIGGTRNGFQAEWYGSDAAADGTGFTETDAVTGKNYIDLLGGTRLAGGEFDGAGSGTDGDITIRLSGRLDMRTGDDNRSYVQIGHGGSVVGDPTRSNNTLTTRDGIVMDSADNGRAFFSASWRTNLEADPYRGVENRVEGDITIQVAEDVLVNASPGFDNNNLDLTQEDGSDGMYAKIGHGGSRNHGSYHGNISVVAEGADTDGVGIELRAGRGTRRGASIGHGSDSDGNRRNIFDVTKSGDVNVVAETGAIRLLGYNQLPRTGDDNTGPFIDADTLLPNDGTSNRYYYSPVQIGHGGAHREQSTEDGDDGFFADNAAFLANALSGFHDLPDHSASGNINVFAGGTFTYNDIGDPGPGVDPLTITGTAREVGIQLQAGNGQYAYAQIGHGGAQQFFNTALDAAFAGTLDPGEQEIGLRGDVTIAADQGTIFAQGGEERRQDSTDGFGFNFVQFGHGGYNLDTGNENDANSRSRNDIQVFEGNINVSAGQDSLLTGLVNEGAIVFRSGRMRHGYGMIGHGGSETEAAIAGIGTSNIFVTARDEIEFSARQAAPGDVYLSLDYVDDRIVDGALIKSVGVSHTDGGDVFERYLGSGTTRRPQSSSGFNSEWDTSVKFMKIGHGGYNFTEHGADRTFSEDNDITVTAGTSENVTNDNNADTGGVYFKGGDDTRDFIQIGHGGWENGGDGNVIGGDITITANGSVVMDASNGGISRFTRTTNFGGVTRDINGNIIEAGQRAFGGQGQEGFAMIGNGGYNFDGDHSGSITVIARGVGSNLHVIGPNTGTTINTVNGWVGPTIEESSSIALQLGNAHTMTALEEASMQRRGFTLYHGGSNALLDDNNKGRIVEGSFTWDVDNGDLRDEPTGDPDPNIGTLVGTNGTLNGQTVGTINYETGEVIIDGSLVTSQGAIGQVEDRDDRFNRNIDYQYTPIAGGGALTIADERTAASDSALKPNTSWLGHSAIVPGSVSIVIDADGNGGGRIVLTDNLGDGQLRDSLGNRIADVTYDTGKILFRTAINASGDEVVANYQYTDGNADRAFVQIGNGGSASGRGGRNSAGNFGAINLTANGDIRVHGGAFDGAYAQIGHGGDGVQSRHGVQADQLDNTNPDLTFGGDTSGDINITAGGILEVIAGRGLSYYDDAQYAQIGHGGRDADGHHQGNITIRTGTGEISSAPGTIGGSGQNGGLVLTAGQSTNAYTQLGHGGMEARSARENGTSGIRGNYGNIDVETSGDISFTSGTLMTNGRNFDDGRLYSQLGHGGYNADIRNDDNNDQRFIGVGHTGDLRVVSTNGSINFSAGGAANAPGGGQLGQGFGILHYTQIGNGGYAARGSHSGNITVSAANNVRFLAGGLTIDDSTDKRNYAILGHGGDEADGHQGGRDANNLPNETISVTATNGDIDFLAGPGRRNWVQLGNGGLNTNGDHMANIDVVAGGDINFLGGQFRDQVQITGERSHNLDLATWDFDSSGDARGWIPLRYRGVSINATRAFTITIDGNVIEGTATGELLDQSGAITGTAGQQVGELNLRDGMVRFFVDVDTGNTGVFDLDYFQGGTARNNENQGNNPFFGAALTEINNTGSFGANTPALFATLNTTRGGFTNVPDQNNAPFGNNIGIESSSFRMNVPDGTIIEDNGSGQLVVTTAAAGSGLTVNQQVGVIDYLSGAIGLTTAVNPNGVAGVTVDYRTDLVVNSDLSYAQLGNGGYEADFGTTVTGNIGDISVQAGDDIQFMAGLGDSAYTQLGNGGRGNQGSSAGSIGVTAGGGILFQAAAQQSGFSVPLGNAFSTHNQAYAMLGNGGYDADGSHGRIHVSGESVVDNGSFTLSRPGEGVRTVVFTNADGSYYDNGDGDIIDAADDTTVVGSLNYTTGEVTLTQDIDVNDAGTTVAYTSRTNSDITVTAGAFDAGHAEEGRGLVFRAGDADNTTAQLGHGGHAARTFGTFRGQGEGLKGDITVQSGGDILFVAGTRFESSPFDTSDGRNFAQLGHGGDDVDVISNAEFSANQSGNRVNMRGFDGHSGDISVIATDGSVTFLGGDSTRANQTSPGANSGLGHYVQLGHGGRAAQGDHNGNITVLAGIDGAGNRSTTNPDSDILFAAGGGTTDEWADGNSYAQLGHGGENDGDNRADGGNMGLVGELIKVQASGDITFTTPGGINSYAMLGNGGTDTDADHAANIDVLAFGDIKFEAAKNGSYTAGYAFQRSDGDGNEHRSLDRAAENLADTDNTTAAAGFATLNYNRAVLGTMRVIIRDDDQNIVMVLSDIDNNGTLKVESVDAGISNVDPVAVGDVVGSYTDSGIQFNQDVNPGSNAFGGTLNVAVQYTTTNTERSYVQLGNGGYDADDGGAASLGNIGDITINAGGDLILTAGDGVHNYAQIGHGGSFNQGQNEGNIIIGQDVNGSAPASFTHGNRIGGGVVITAGRGQLFSDTDSYAQIGHGGNDADGTAVGDIKLYGSQTSGGIGFQAQAGIRNDAYAMFGHGGPDARTGNGNNVANAEGHSGEIVVDVTGDVNLISGVLSKSGGSDSTSVNDDGRLITQIGHGGYDSDTSLNGGDVRGATASLGHRGDITVITSEGSVFVGAGDVNRTDNPSMALMAGDVAGGRFHYSLIGHGGHSSRGNHSGNIMVHAGFNATGVDTNASDDSNITVLGGMATQDNSVERINFGMIGHGGRSAEANTLGGTDEVISVMADGDISFRAGDGQENYVQLGNGGRASRSDQAADIRVLASGSIEFLAGTFANAPYNAHYNAASNRGNLSLDRAADTDLVATRGNGTNEGRGIGEVDLIHQRIVPGTLRLTTPEGVVVEDVNGDGNLIVTSTGSFTATDLEKTGSVSVVVGTTVFATINYGNGRVTFDGDFDMDPNSDGGGADPTYAQRIVADFQYSGDTDLAYAQLGNGGYDADQPNNNTALGGRGNISVAALNGSITLTGGSDDSSYAQFGNGGYATKGAHSGDIHVRAGQDVTLTGGGTTRSSAQIGHGGYDADGNHRGVIKVSAGTGSLFTSLGEGQFNDIGDFDGDMTGDTFIFGATNAGEGRVNLNGGTANETYAQIGHGGYETEGNHGDDSSTTPDDEGVIGVSSLGDINVIGGTGARSFAQIGHGGARSEGDLGGAVHVIAEEGDLTVRAGNGGEAYALIGHGDDRSNNVNNSTGNRAGGIQVIANQISLERSGAETAWIGHTFRRTANDNNPFAVANVELSNLNAASSYTPGGYQVIGLDGLFTSNNGGALSSPTIVITDNYRDTIINPNIAFGDFALTSGNIDVNSLLDSTSGTFTGGAENNNFSLFASGNIRVREDIQNPGSGDINLIAGASLGSSSTGIAVIDAPSIGGANYQRIDHLYCPPTGHISFTGVKEAGYDFGTSTGTVVIDPSGTDTASGQSAAVGSRLGDTTVVGYGVTVSGGDFETNYAQIGFNSVTDTSGNATGNIMVEAGAGGVLVQGGGINQTFAQIGHGGDDGLDAGLPGAAVPGVVGDTDPTHSGMISVRADRSATAGIGNIRLNGIAGDRWAQIGHGGDAVEGDHSGDIIVIGEGIDLNGGNTASWTQIGHGGKDSDGNLSGNIYVNWDPAANTGVGAAVGGGGDLSLVANGTGSDSYNQIGHGGRNQDGTKDGNIIVGQAANIILTGGTNSRHYGQIGHGGSNASGSVGSLQSSTITINGTGNLVLTGGSAGNNYVQIGHGGHDVIGDIGTLAQAADITVTLGGNSGVDSVIIHGGTSQEAYAQIGHGGDEATGSGNGFFGDVTVTTGAGNISIAANNGNTQGGNRAFAMVGHGGFGTASANGDFSGNIRVETGDGGISLDGSDEGNNNFAMIGHGGIGNDNTTGITGTITALATNDIIAFAGATDSDVADGNGPRFAKIGHGGSGVDGNMTGNIIVGSTTGRVSFTSGDQATFFSQIGHGGNGGSGDFTGEIEVVGGGDISFTAGAGTTSFSQLGHGGNRVGINGTDAGHTGSIYVASLGGSISFSGGVENVGASIAAGNEAYAQLGHGGFNTDGNHSGAMVVRANGGITFAGGEALSGYAHLGHGGQNSDAAATATGQFGGDITVQAGASGSITDFVDTTNDFGAAGPAAALSFTAGSGEDTYAQIGHGGRNSIASVIGNIDIDATGAITLRGASGAANTANRSYAQFGHGGRDADARSNVGFQGNVDVFTTSGSIEVSAGNSNTAHAQIGHGGRNEFTNDTTTAGGRFGTAFRGDISVVTQDGNISVTGGTAGNAMGQIGHGGRNRAVIAANSLGDTGHTGSITVNAGDTDGSGDDGDISITATATTDGAAMIGHGGRIETGAGAPVGGHTASTIDVDAARNISLTGGGARSFAQIGLGGEQNIGDHSAVIDVSAAAGTLMLDGGAGTDAYAQIGNGGHLAAGSHTGNVTVASQGTIDVHAGTGTRAYAQIGHGGNAAGTGANLNDGAISVTSSMGSLSMLGGGTSASSQIGHGGVNTQSDTGTAVTGTTIDISIAGSGELISGTGDNSYAQIGHGGTNAAADHLGDICVHVGTTWNLDAAQNDSSGVNAYVQIGHGGNNASGNHAGDVTVVSGFTGAGGVTMLAGDQTNRYVHIGHGGAMPAVRNMNLSGDIFVVANNGGNLVMTGGAGNGSYVMAGHGDGFGTYGDFGSGITGGTREGGLQYFVDGDSILNAGTGTNSNVHLIHRTNDSGGLNSTNFLGGDSYRYIVNGSTIGNSAATASRENQGVIVAGIAGTGDIFITDNTGADVNVGIPGNPGDQFTNDGFSFVVLATGNINFNRSVQNSGDGLIALVAGWDGNQDPSSIDFNNGVCDPNITPGAIDFDDKDAWGNTFANTGNSIHTEGKLTIGNASQTEAVMVGSRDGNTILRGYEIELIGSDTTANAFTQVGYFSDGTDIDGPDQTIPGYRPSIDVQARAGGLTLTSGAAAGAYTQIGHGGFGTTPAGRVNTASNINDVVIHISFCEPADVTLNAGGGNNAFARIGHGSPDGATLSDGEIEILDFRNLSLNGGATGSGTGAAAQVGHTGDGAKTGSITLTGSTTTSGNVTLTSGSNDGAFTQIGHGGNDQDGAVDDQSDIAITNVVDVSLNGGGTNAFSQIGNGGLAQNGNLSGDVTISATGNIGVNGGTGAQSYGLIGLGGHNADGTHNGNISVTTTGGGLTMMGGQNTDAFSMIGIGGYSNTGTLGGAATTVEVITSGTIDLDAGTGNRSFVQIGVGGYDSDGAQDGLITVESTGGAFSMNGGGADAYGLVGIGGKNVNTATLGSATTKINLTADGNIDVVGGTGNNAFAQVGVGGENADAAAIGDIKVTSNSGSVSVTGGPGTGTTSQAYAQIGNSGSNVAGNANGSIEIDAATSITLQGGDDSRNYALVGHGGVLSGGAYGDADDFIRINAGTFLDLRGGINASESDNAFAQIGHGGLAWVGSVSMEADIDVTAGTDINLIGGLDASDDDSWAKIGHGGNDTETATISGDIRVDVRNGTLKMESGLGGTDTGNFTQVGHGGPLTEGAMDGQIVVLADSIDMDSGGAADAFSQIGHGGFDDENTLGANLSGNIYINVDPLAANAVVGGNGNISLNSSGSTDAYTQIGHGGGERVANLSGNIVIGKAANIELLGEGTRAYSQLGHGGGTPGSTVASTKTGTITITESTGITLNGGTGSDSYAQIGHGGNENLGNTSGNIDIMTSGELDITGGTTTDAYAQVGHGGHLANGDHGVANEVLRIAANALDLNSGGSGAYAQLGYGGYDADGIFNAEIYVNFNETTQMPLAGVTGGLTMDAAAANNAYTQIGHGGANSGTETNTKSGDILIGGFTSVAIKGGDGAADAYSQIGHGGDDNRGDASGNVALGTAGSVTMTAGTGSDAYVQIGHGGHLADGTHGVTGNVTTVIAGTGVSLSGNGQRSYAQIGAGGYDLDGTLVGNTFVNFNPLTSTVQGGGAITLNAGATQGAYAHIGLGGAEVDGAKTGDVRVDGDSVALTSGGQDAYSQIGSGGGITSDGSVQQPSGTIASNVIVNATSGNVTLDATGTALQAYTQIGGGGELHNSAMSGTTTVTASGDVILTGGSGSNRAARIGLGGIGVGDGTTSAVLTNAATTVTATNVTMTSGNGTSAFTQIGAGGGASGGDNPFQGTIDGATTVNATGAVSLSSGANTGVFGSFSQIGIGGRGADAATMNGDTVVTFGNGLTLDASAGGQNGYVQIGAGGDDADGVITSNTRVTGTGDIVLTAGGGADSSAQIGSGGNDANGGNITGNVIVDGDSLTLNGGGGSGAQASIGNVFEGDGDSITGAITTNITNQISLNGGSGTVSYAQIGHLLRDAGTFMIDGSVSVVAGGNIALTGGADGGAMIGHGVSSGNAGVLGTRTGGLNVYTDGSITLSDGASGAALISHQSGGGAGSVDYSGGTNGGDSGYSLVGLSGINLPTTLRQQTGTGSSGTLITFAETLADASLAGNVTVASGGTGQLDIGTGSIANVAFDSANDINIFSGGDLNLHIGFQNAGSGNIGLLAGWTNTGTTAAIAPTRTGAYDPPNLVLGNIALPDFTPITITGPVAAGEFGANNAIVRIGDGNQTVGISVGSKTGTTEVLGSGIALSGGTAAGTHSQIGFFGDNSGAMTGAINLSAKTNGVSITGGGADNAFAQVGHGGLSSAGGDIIGDINVRQVEPGSLMISGGSAVNTQALLGHGGNNYSGIMNGNVVTGSPFTQVILNGGSGNTSGARVGHGGLNASGPKTGDIALNASVVLLGAGDGEASTASIGHGGTNGNGDADGSISVMATAGNIEMVAGDAGQAAAVQIGHGGGGYSGSVVSDDITVSASGNIFFTAGDSDSSVAMIGHGGSNASTGGLTGNVTVTAGAEIVGTAGTGRFSFAQIGHGGDQVSNALGGDIEVTSNGGSVRMTGMDPTQGSYAKVGHGDDLRGASAAIAGTGSRTGDISLRATDDIRIRSGLVGHVNDEAVPAATPVDAGNNTTLSVSSDDPTDPAGGNLVVDSNSQVYGEEDLRVYLSERSTNQIEANAVINGQIWSGAPSDPTLTQGDDEFTRFITGTNPSSPLEHNFGVVTDPAPTNAAGFAFYYNSIELNAAAVNPGGGGGIGGIGGGGGTGGGVLIGSLTEEELGDLLTQFDLEIFEIIGSDEFTPDDRTTDDWQRAIRELYTRFDIPSSFQYEGFDQYGPEGEMIYDFFFSNGIEAEDGDIIIPDDVLRRQQQSLEDQEEEDTNSNSAQQDSNDEAGEPLALR